MIIFSDVPLPHSEAVPRREGRLTERDREKLQSENVPGELDDEVSIVRRRYELDRAKMIFDVLESKPDKLLSRSEAFGVIAALMNNIENDGGMAPVMMLILAIHSSVESSSLSSAVSGCACAI